MSKISKVIGRQILDSRGNPTIEVDVILTDGSIGRAAVPSGASTGKHEAVELRDGDKNIFLGKGVSKALVNLEKHLAPAVKGLDVLDQRQIDNKLIECDGTPNKGKIGANAILGVSMAAIHAASNYKKVSLFESLKITDNISLPIPMMNILNGGSHANNSVDIQEFMVFPVGASTFSNALRMGTEIFHKLKSVLNKMNMNTAVGDEGGFAPNLQSNEEAIEVIMEAINLAGYTPGKEIFLALDVAASELFNINEKKYNLESEGKILTSDEIIDYYIDLVNKYPIISIEDGLDEDDWDGWVNLNNKLGDKVQIVGDDLTVTNIKRLEKAINLSAMNTILIKLNQVGTVSETIDTINLARENEMGAIISHRSGETEDTTIADFSVAMGMGQIKTGSASRTDRICKYNQLLRIEENLGDNAIFAKSDILGFKS